MKPTISRFHEGPPVGFPETWRHLTVPIEHGAPPEGGDGRRSWSPRELRAEARDVLDRTRRIGPSLRRGSRQTIDEIDALTASIRVLQARVDVAAREDQDATASVELMGARRCIQESLGHVLDLLTELER